MASWKVIYGLITIFVLSLLITNFIINSYKNGVIDGKSSIKVPMVLISYFSNTTDCSDTIPYKWINYDYNSSRTYSNWDMWIKPNEWKCEPSKQQFDKVIYCNCNLIK